MLSTMPQAAPRAVMNRMPSSMSPPPETGPPVRNREGGGREPCTLLGRRPKGGTLSQKPENSTGMRWENALRRKAAGAAAAAGIGAADLPRAAVEGAAVVGLQVGLGDVVVDEVPGQELVRVALAEH